MKKELSERMLNFKKDDDLTLVKKHNNAKYSSYKSDIRLVLNYRVDKLIKKIKRLKSYNYLRFSTQITVLEKMKSDLSNTNIVIIMN